MASATLDAGLQTRVPGPGVASQASGDLETKGSPKDPAAISEARPGLVNPKDIALEINATIKREISLRVEEIFGTNKGLRDEPENGSDDDEGLAYDGTWTFSDVFYMMRAARRHFEQARRRQNKLRREKAAKEAAMKMGIDKSRQDSARQISTTAFLEGDPARVRWIDWNNFVWKRGQFEDSLMAPIFAVISEPDPQLLLQLRPFDIEDETLDMIMDRETIRRLDNGIPGQVSLPERIKFHSAALHAVLSTRVDKEQQWTFGEDGTMVFLRPFKVLVYQTERLREVLHELESRYQGWDGKRYPPGKDTHGNEAPSTEGGAVLDDGPKDQLARGQVTMKEKIDKNGMRLRGTQEPERLYGPKTAQEAKEEEDENERTATSITALLHMRCLMKFIDDEIKPKLEYIEGDGYRRILYHDLWHLYKPGNEVVDQSEKQAYRVIRVQIPQHNVENPWLRWSRKRSRNRGVLGEQVDNEDDRTQPVTVHCAYIDYDGKQFGPVSVKFSISPFGGHKDIKSLPIYPLRFSKNKELRQKLIARGKMLLDIAKFKPMYYQGFTLDTREEIDSQVVVDFSEALSEAHSDEKRKKWAPAIESLRTAPDDREDQTCRSACCHEQAVQADEYIDSRLTEEFVKSLIPDASYRAPSLMLTPRLLEATMPGSEDQPREEEFVVMTYRAFGFVLRSRKWAQLDLTYLRYENTDVRESTLNAFDRLQLPDGHREMVRSLVTQHFRDKQAGFAKDNQTDLIRGKGKGLILLLHGAPGVGKTTTAEGVAELFEKPLFQITCGDLGTTAQHVEQELEKNFALASRWGCILLLDEADVFLSARERKDFVRNGLVAVFLRVLEYYAGILFLTTNRIGDFDEAFASRIHMSLYYPELDEEKTKKVCELNLDLIKERFKRQGREIIVDESSIREFAQNHFHRHPYNRWNGRQIRNACQTALALAEFDAHGSKIKGEIDKDVKVYLQLKYFLVVQAAYLDFNHYLGDIRGTQGDRRAIDYGLRARTDTPYQTTPSRFSGAGARPGMRDYSNQYSRSSDYQNYTHHPQPQGSFGGGEFQPTFNQGGSYGGGGGSSTGHIYNNNSYGGSQHGHVNAGGGAYGRYDTTPARGYPPQSGNNPMQMDPGVYSPQSGNQRIWRDGNPGGSGISQAYPSGGESQKGHGQDFQEQRQGFQARSPQGQYAQGQSQFRESQQDQGQQQQFYGQGSQGQNLHGHGQEHGPSQSRYGSGYGQQSPAGQSYVSGNDSANDMRYASGNNQSVPRGETDTQGMGHSGIPREPSTASMRLN